MVKTHQTQLSALSWGRFGRPTMKAATEVLAEFDVPFGADVVSAHRMPEEMIATERARPIEACARHCRWRGRCGPPAGNVGRRDATSGHRVPCRAEAP